MDESMTYQGIGTAPRQAAGATRAQEHALFGQLAASIFRDVLNVFLFLLTIFTRGEEI
jgi:hypothetical protein